MAKKSDSYNPNEGGGFGKFLYDSDTGAVMGRTCGSWIKITVFYIIFYACLSGFFYLCYQIFATTLERPEDGGSPKWRQDSSLIGSNPGVGFRPMPDQDKNSESTLIWFNHKKPEDFTFWSDQLADFADKSQPPEGANNVVECNLINRAGPHKVCKVQLDKNLGNNCTKDNHFGYATGNPCVLIKLNKIYDWEPEPFGVENGKYDADQLEKDLTDKVEEENGMPETLKAHILDEVKKNPEQAAEVLKTAWISCLGENVGDQENLPAGNIKYNPGPQIPGYFFPYRNQPNYKTPFIMVQLVVPESSRHTLINVECRAWAKNIHYDRQNRLGSVHFEILVD